MQLGNRNELDAARDAMRDAFDAVWLASDTIGTKEARAVRCAIKLDQPRLHHASPNWTIFKGGRLCGSHNAVIRA